MNCEPLTVGSHASNALHDEREARRQGLRHRRRLRRKCVQAVRHPQTVEWPLPSESMSLVCDVVRTSQQVTVNKCAYWCPTTVRRLLALRHNMKRRHKVDKVNRDTRVMSPRGCGLGDSRGSAR